MWKNDLIKKKSLLSKPVTSQPGEQVTAIHILTDISRTKDNQAMKLDQLLKCNMRNTFPEKLHTKCGGKTIPRPFSKNSKLNISLDQYNLKLYTPCFYCILS